MVAQAAVAPANRTTIHTTKLEKYVGFYHKMIPIRDEYPDNADFNERVNTRISQIADVMNLAIRQGLKVIVKLRNGTEIIPKSVGGYYDFHFLTYIDESDTEGTNWKDFDLEKVVAITVEEKPIESVIGVDPSTLPLAVKPMEHEYNLPIGIVDDGTGDDVEDAWNPFGANGYEVVFNDDGTFAVEVPEQVRRGEDAGCTCEECQRERARTRNAEPQPIDHEQLIQQAMQRVFRNTYVDDVTFNTLADTLLEYRRNRA